MILLLFLISSHVAVESVRRPMFERTLFNLGLLYLMIFIVFWYTHHLFVVFLVAICVHGAGHIFGRLFLFSLIFSSLCSHILCTTSHSGLLVLYSCNHYLPLMAMHRAWVLPSSIAYLFERLVRLVRGYQSTMLHLVRFIRQVQVILTPLCRQSRILRTS